MSRFCFICHRWTNHQSSSCPRRARAKAALLALVLLLAPLLGACSTMQGAESNSGACISLKRHFPQKLRKADTPETKTDGYRRNTAFGAACRGY